MCNKCKRNQKRKIIDKSNLFEINFSGLCEECFEDKIEDYYLLKEESLGNLWKKEQVKGIDIFMVIPIIIYRGWDKTKLKTETET